MRQAARAASHRNRFAHWCWAFCRELPNALLFIDPAVLLGHDMASGALSAPFDGRGLLGDLDTSHVLVYREPDLKEAIEALRKASYCIAHFRMMLNPIVMSSDSTKEWRDRIYQLLITEPEVAQALAQLNERRKNDPKARPSRRRKGRTP
jgi:hypothetical protein